MNLSSPNKYHMNETKIRPAYLNWHIGAYELLRALQSAHKFKTNNAGNNQQKNHSTKYSAFTFQ